MKPPVKKEYRVDVYRTQGPNELPYEWFVDVFHASGRGRRRKVSYSHKQRRWSVMKPYHVDYAPMQLSGKDFATIEDVAQYLVLLARMEL